MYSFLDRPLHRMVRRAFSLSTVFAGNLCRARLTLAAAALLVCAGAHKTQAQTTFNGGGAISITGTTVHSGNSSTLSVSGATGSVKTVFITLDGVDASGSGNNSGIGCSSFVLEGPGDQKFLLLGDTGADDTMSNATIVVEDGKGAAPLASGDSNTDWSTTGGTVEPSSYWNGGFGWCGLIAVPSELSGVSLPQTDGSATLTNTFGSTDANGTWTLAIYTDDPDSADSDPISITGWSLTMTFNTGVSIDTTTSVSSNITNPGLTTSSYTYTATVTSSPSGTTVDAGTVDFTANGATISGCGAKAVSGGTATCNTTFSTQGLYPIVAMYSGGTDGVGNNFDASTSSAFNQLVEVTSTGSTTTNTWCNGGSLAVPGTTVPVAYPSVIKVSGYPAGTTVANVEVELNSATGFVDAQHLLVAPTNTFNLDFFDQGFDSAFSASGSIDLDFLDGGSSGYPDYPSGDDAPAAGSYLASDESGVSDTFSPSSAPTYDSSIPQVPGTVNYGYDPFTANPHGPITATFENNFNGAPANGAWALYPYQPLALTETIGGGWCIVLTLNSGVATTTTLTSSANPAVAQAPVTLTAAVKAGSSPVTNGGTVTFLENGTAPAGTTGGDNVVNLNTSTGQSSFTTPSGTSAVSTTVHTDDSGDTKTIYEGDYDMTADYSGVADEDDLSSGNLWQRFNSATTFSAGSGGSINACNSGPVLLDEDNNKGPFEPNPSNIFVSGMPGTVNAVTLSLNGFYTSNSGAINETESLIEGPTDAALDFFSNTGDSSTQLGTTTSPFGTLTFADSASSTVTASGSTFTSSTNKPTAVGSTPDTFTSSSSGFYNVPGTITYAQPHDGGTFASTFASTNPNGTWSLFFNTTDNVPAEGAQSGWCLNFTENPVTVTVDENHSGAGTDGDFIQGETNAQITAAVTNNGTGSTGDPTGGSNPLTVVDTLNSALTYESFSGTNWSCSATGQTVTCTNDSAIAQGDAYPTLTLNVNVSSSAPASIGNSVSVTGGAGVTATNSSTDNITVDSSQVAPAITSGSSTTFTVGTTSSFTVTATGSPTPTFSETGALPSGVTFAINGTLSGTPAAGTGGTYAITITASNGVAPNATQNFTLTVDQAPAITSASSATFTVGTAGSFTATATGFPTPTFSETGALPSGVTFAINGTLSGTPAAGTGGTYAITITASNGVAPNATQNFTLTVDQAPAITSASATTFTAGTLGSFTATATGFPTPTFSETGALPSGVTFAINGTLSGTPAAGTGGTYAITITASNGVAPNATQNFTLTVDQAPAITSASATTFTAGTLGSFTATATGFPTPTFSETGALPSGVTFAINGTLSGTPAAGTGGTYAITITASNGVAPNATQNFTLTVDQAPAITSASATTFTAGTLGSFTATATGFPTPTFSETGALPSGVTFAINGTLSGTPAAGPGGTYAITITASNGVAPNATQNFTLTVDQAPAITSANNTAFIVGVPGTFTVTTTAFPAAALSLSGTLPSGIAFNDNGNGTGTLQGTAAAGTAGSYPVTIAAMNGTGVNAQQSFTLTIDAVPSFVVTNTNDSGTGSLRAALSSAATAGAGSITFDSTVFSAPAGATIALTSGTLTIPPYTSIAGPTSGSGASLTNLVTVAGGGSTSNFSVFTVSSGVAGAAIANLTIEKGNNTSSGGGIRNNGTLTVTGSTFYDDSASAILNSGTLTVTNSTFNSNSAPGGGGGGINNNGGTLTVTGSTFNSNSAPGGGGGGINNNGGTLTVTNSTFNSNSAPGGEGGGINNNGGTWTVTGSTFSDDSATNGGGIFNNTGTLTVTNSTFNSNSAPGGGGGGINNNGGTLTVTNSTFSGNSASAGGGILNDGGGVLNLANSIVAGNSATGSYADIENGSTYNNHGGNQAGTGSSGTSAIAIDLAPLGSYGGPTQTMIPLPGSSGSPAICAGSYSLAQSAEISSDQRGVTFGNTGAGGYCPAGSVDAGAVQTDYAMLFTTNPPATVIPNTNFTAGVTVDEDGSPFTAVNASVGLTLNGTGTLTNSGTSPVTLTTTNGVASSSALEVNTAGSPDALQASLTLSATATLVVLSQNFNAQGGQATHFSVTAPSTSNAGAGFHVTVTALDAGNNVAAGYTGTVHFISTDPRAVPPSNSTLTNGSGTFTAVLETAGVQTITATDTSNSSIAGTSNVVTVNPGPAASLVVSAPSTAFVGGPFNFTVTALDSYGNVATVFTDPVVFTSSDGAAKLPGTTTLIPAAGTFSATLMTTGNQTITATDGSQSAITGTSGPIAVTIPGFVVNTTNDDATGAASGCTSVPEGGCTLRDALAAAAADGSANITFDPTVFAAPSTITLSSAGTLTIPSNTTIQGLTAGTGAALVNLVTVSGNNATTVFSVNSGVTGAAIASLNITDGNTTSEGGGIYSNGALTVTRCTLSGNSGSNGGGIDNDFNATLTVTGSTFTGNTAAYGGGILNNGALTVTDSTFSSNTATSDGGGILNNNGLSQLTVTDSTVSSNFAGNGGGIGSSGTLNLANSIVAGNSATGSFADIDASTYNDNGGNQAGTSSSGTSTINPHLTTLGSYGGPTQTMIPDPGSPAICAGTATPSGGLTLPSTDQRGVAFNAGGYCPAGSVDAGAVQTDYALGFTTEPSPIPPAAAIFANTSFQAAVTLDENGAPFTAEAVTIPLTLASVPAGATLSGGSASTSAGAANYSTLQVSASGTNDELTANLTLNSALNPAVAISAASSQFNVGQLTPALSFTPSPASQTYGTAITAGSLDATATYNSANVQGTFAYTTTVGGNPVTLVAGTTVLPAGSYTITAAFTPSAPTVYNGASITTSYTVGQAVLTIAANNATKTYGTANPAFNGSVTGAVNGDTFVESFSTTVIVATPVGNYTIVPSVTGADLGDYMQTIVDGTLTVTQAVSITTVGLSSASIIPGQSETITVTVASSTTGTPTGSVNIYDGTTLLTTVPLTNGIATYTTSTLAPSLTHVIGAVYSGDGNFTGSTSSTTASVTVAPLDFTMTITGPSSATVIPGQSVSYQVTVTPLYGSYAGTVNFAIAGLPPGATATFSPASIAANGGPQTVTVTIAAPPAFAANPAPPTPSPTRRAAPLALAFLLLFGLGAVRRRTRGLRRLAIVLLLAGGAAATLVSGCGGGFFAQAPQNYNVTITATAGSLQHTANVTLNVQ